MPRLLDVRQRRREPEIMDQPGLDPRRHVEALRGLERINRFSGSARILWPAILELARSSAAPLRLLDVATGGGDVPLRLWQRAQKAGIALGVDGCDRSTCAIDHARANAVRLGADVRFFEWDALSGPLPDGYDIIVSSLFLHHLDEEQAIDLLRRMAAAARRLVLINDLERSVGGLLLAYIGTRLLSASPVVHVDGPLSVSGAFTCREALTLARTAGLEGTTVQRRWPFRFLLTWRRRRRRPSKTAGEDVG
ncbi:MAG TPA: methyltransferase domain-containing protein [Gemmataceae bacterium]|nr:methyltransferase domain-containing protein [Gemmataceae bacterium]